LLFQTEVVNRHVVLAALSSQLGYNPEAYGTEKQRLMALDSKRQRLIDPGSGQGKLWVFKARDSWFEP
jgi:hypothetical protein